MTNGSRRMFQEITDSPLRHANGINKELAGNTNDIIDIHNTFGSESGFILGIVEERHDIVKFLEHLGNRRKDHKQSVIVTPSKVNNAALGGLGPRLSIGMTRRVVGQRRRCRNCTFVARKVDMDCRCGGSRWRLFGGLSTPLCDMVKVL